MNTLEMILTALSGWLIGAFGWFKFLHELREKRQEKSAKEKAEAALREIRRRATDSSPYLLVSKYRFNGVTVPTNNPTQQLFMPPGSPSLLCFMRDKVDTQVPAGELIYLLVENNGSDAYEIAIHLDGELASLIQVQADRRHVLHAIRYPYHPEWHGREQVIKISFLAANGVRDTHRYATAHGIRALKRTDPT